MFASMTPEQERKLVRELTQHGWVDDPLGHARRVIIRVCNCSGAEASSVLDRLVNSRLEVVSASGGATTDAPLKSSWRWKERMQTANNDTHEGV